MKNPWLDRRVLIYAHQGGALEAPSSTMFAFRRAVDLGCPALEMDVHMTNDGVLVVSHDETTTRTTNLNGVIARLTWEELQVLDNAYWFVPDDDHPQGQHETAYLCRGRFPSDRAFGFASLEEVLESFPNTFLNFDIKETGPAVPPYEAALAATLRRFGRASDVIVASFHDSALTEFRRVAPEIHTSLGPVDTLAVGLAIAGEQPEPALHESCVALQVPMSYGDIPIITKEFVNGAHERNLAVHAWTIDTESEIRDLLAIDVDGIITDRPELGVNIVGTHMFR